MGINCDNAYINTYRHTKIFQIKMFAIETSDVRLCKELEI